MAVGIRDHCHLDVVNPPVAEYSVRADGWDFTPNTAVTFERGITGQLHAHRLLTGSDPIQFDEDKDVLICTLAEMLVVKELAGKVCYYVSNHHDDDEAGAGLGPSAWPGSSYVVRCLLIISQGAITNLSGALCEYWTVQLQIIDDDKVT